MSFLTLTSLTKTYPDGTEAVKSIDLTLEEGEFVVLLGPSGCGKTTTLRMIAGLEIPTGGTIRMAGQDVTSWRPSKRDVGFVSQFYALYPHLTVRENICFPLRSQGLPKPEIDTALERVAARLGLAPLLGKHPRHLSGGDQQRVSLARAMVRRPRVYLMDEPLGTLDADLRLEMRELIRAQQLDMGVTTVYVTHDQEEAMSLGDRIVVMDQGRIRQAASPAEAYDHPADLFVAHFLGSPGMNFLEGEITRHDQDLVLIGAEGRLSLPSSLSVRAGKTTLGVRPENLRLDENGSLGGKVILDEYRGSSRNLHLETAFGRIIVRIRPGDRLEPGESVRVGLEEAGIRLFDGRSGNRL